MQLSLTAIRAIIWRQRFIFAGVILLVVVGTLIWTLLQTPIYQAEAKIRVNLFGTTIVEGQDVSDPFVPTTQVGDYLITLSEVIQSRSMALKVADAMNLHNNAQFIADAGIGGDDTLSEEERRQIAASILQGNLEVTPPARSQILAVGYSSSNPVLAAEIANGYAENFLTDDIDQSVAANAYAQEYLEEQIADVRRQLREAEITSIDYARSNQIIGQSSDAGAQAATSGTAPTLTASNLASINTRYIEARAERLSAEARWNAVANVPAAQIAEVQQDAAIQRLLGERAQLEGRLADLRVRYRDDYPAVQELQSQIEELNGQIASMRSDVKQRLRNEYLAAVREENILSDELRRVSQNSLEEQDRRVQFNQIDRDVQSLRSQLDSLLARYNQIAAAANIQSSKFTLLDPARIPTGPSSPNLWRNLLVALVLAIALAIAIAVLREILDDKLRTIEELETRLKLTALGQTPYVADEVSDDLDNRFSPISEAYSSIRASLEYYLGDVKGSAIQFTSNSPGEGKTTSASAVAQKFAAVGYKVLLVDMDLRRPALAARFGVARPKSGLVEVLHGHLPLQSAIIPSGKENLDLLLTAKSPAQPVEILSSGLVPAMLAQAKMRYDLVIVDSSPVLGIADAPLLSRSVDAVVMIIEANRGHMRDVRTAVRRLQDMNANIVGAIMTKYRALEAGESYNYQYQYYSYNAED
nr:polysaccharide biosynthesis tyrosine autokinase [Alteraurantiacibacter aquimixticola]